MDRRVERLLGALSLDALEDHRVVAHAAADESLLSRLGGSAALADDPDRPAEVLLAPGEVVVVVDFVHGSRAEDAEDVVDHDVASRVGVLPGQRHRFDVGLAELAVDRQEHRRRVHLPLARARVE